MRSVQEYNVLLAACESILGGAGMRLWEDAWPSSYLVLNDGPPSVVARSSFGGIGSGAGAGAGAMAEPGFSQKFKPNMCALNVL